MTTARFDPFNKRLARDIRNSLSRAFLRALAAKDQAVFKQCGEFHLQQILPPAYQKYVIERLKKYEKVYRLIEQEKIGQNLQQAAVFWDFDLYYEMHELLEQDWKNASGDRRRALQGLIRAVGMKIHAENNNMRAAVSMGTKAQVDLQKYGRELAGFVKLDAILAEIERITAATGKRTGGNRGN